MTSTDRIRIIPHSPDGIPDCGSFEVWFPDGRKSVYFHWDDDAGRRPVLMSVKMTQAEAKKAAQDLARDEQEKLGPRV